MPNLLLSDWSVTTLQSLAASSILPEELRSELADALAQPVPQPALIAARTATNTPSNDLPAVAPPEAVATPSTASSDLPAVLSLSPTAVHHSLLVRVVSAVRTSEMSSSAEPNLTLASLIQGSQVYIPPRPQYQRPPELDALLSKIKAAQDKSEYDAMVQGHSPTSHHINWTSARTSGTGTKAYVPIVPHEPTLLQNPINSPDDQETWRQIRSGLSAIASVLLSMAGVVTAVWQAGGTASVVWKTLVALLLALVVAAAETFLYMRAFGFFHPETAKPAKQTNPPTRPLPTATVPDEEAMARLRVEQDEAVTKLLAHHGQVSASAVAWANQAGPPIGQTSALQAGRRRPRNRKGN